ncbi:MAG: efflux transporter outer membrane subunit [Tepidisphaeraceae bacterium]|jgi:NodT family efflux transporter outer membrane factor (OMF) lipoprotein
MKAAKRMSVLVVSVALSGCTVGPDYHTPTTTMPGAFTSMSPSTQPAAAARKQPADIARWWNSFSDPELDSLIDRGLAANFDLEIALTRLQEARTMEVAVEGPAFPSIEASGGAGGGTGTNATKGRISPPLNAASNTTGLKEITQIAGFDAGWELDLFGRYRREIEAAHYDTQAAAESRNAVLIAVVADVARAYVDNRALQMRIAIIRGNIRAEQQMVDLVQERFNRGLTNELDLVLAQRQLATLQSEVAPLEDQAASSQRRLAVLIGDYPDELSAELRQPAPLPDVPSQIQPGLPIELLRRRPDIREAERQLAAGTARVGQAIANLFPRVGVTAGAGWQGQGLGRVPQVSGFIWSAGPTAYWPLLDFGTLDAMIQIQDLRTHELFVDYKRTVINAVEEVENAIGGYDAQQQRLGDLQSALVASQRAVDLAQHRYERGLTDFLNVLDAERELYDLQDQYAVAQETSIVQFIALCKAIGGGWEQYQRIPPIRRPLPAIAATLRQAISPDNPVK